VELPQLVTCQHGVITRQQLLELGWSKEGIKHAIRTGRLHPIHRGVYAFGRRMLGPRGFWLAAVLCCGPDAQLSHGSAAAAWGMERRRGGPIDVSIPATQIRKRAGLRVHRRGDLLERDRTVHHNIPITSPVMTIVDLAPNRGLAQIERAINEADVLDLIDPEELRRSLNRCSGYPGVAKVRAIIDRHTFVLTKTELERRFNLISHSAGLSLPLREAEVHGFDVDFFWPDLGLIVETDGLRYHRTPAAQTRDRLRDQAHTASGLTPLRFTHYQVKYQATYVRTRLMQTVQHLRRRLQAAG
jgi:hypothetical protein